ncbi:MAG: type II secretion system F family protein [Eubacterium sp.]|nr:type II secretion system F family protein [Eubacterium sp.]
MRVDYNKYKYSVREWLLYGTVGAAAGFGLMYLFYSGILYCAVGAVSGAFIFLFIQKKRLCEKRKATLMTEFKDALGSMISALSAGYSMENAVTEAYKDLKLLYGEERIILRELADIQARIDLGVQVDELFYELGVRSGVSDIIIFAQVYTTARKSGGNLIKVMKRTADAITEKLDIEREVATMISGKRLESVCMMIIPLLIIAYLRVFSPGLLDPLYHGLPGRMFMTVALLVYGGAVAWSMRIMRVRY